jgi:hypothetical protein
MSDDFPDKPTRMRWRTYMRLRHSHDFAPVRCTMGLTQFLGRRSLRAERREEGTKIPLAPNEIHSDAWPFSIR